jgi:hypothetical protein
MLEVGFKSLLFITDKMRDLSLQELQFESVSHERHDSGTNLADQGNPSQIPQGITSTTTRSIALMQQIQSTTNNVRQVMINSEIGLGPFMRNSAGLSGKARRSAVHRHTTLWPLGS